MLPHEKGGKRHRYEEIAENLANLIMQGGYELGEPVPSVRKLSKQLGVSVPTILQAYSVLENRGFIESRPQSGYYVCYTPKNTLPEAGMPDYFIIPSHFYGENMVIDIHKATRIPGIIPLGVGIPSPEILPGRELNRIMANICKNTPNEGIIYEFPPGNEQLRKQIAKLSVGWGCDFAPDNIIITTGATEAINICLKAVARPGDIILTESPTYFGILQIIESLGMIALEIPTHSRDGIDVDLVKTYIERHPVKACVLIPNFNNPLGALMPDENKRALYQLLWDRDIPLIEDDVSGDLYFGAKRPKPIKSLDEKGLVMYCGSFSKAVAPGYRVGYVEAGRYYEALKRHKLTTNLATPSLPQMAVAEFLKAGLYERSLLTIRKTYAQQIARMSEAISEHFPEGVRLSRPQGSFFLWVELPKAVDSVKLQELALQKNINIAPGLLFSSKKEFQNFIRLNCGYPWSSTVDSAIKTLGQFCKKLNRP